MNELEKVMAVNDYLVSHTTYIKGTGNPYGPLFGGTGVCQGYAYTTELLLNKAGITCVRIDGYAGVDSSYTNDILDALDYTENLHSWNLVQIDGQWYHLDVTYNDAAVNGRESAEGSYQYFLLSDQQIQTDHMWRKTFYPKAEKPFYNEKQVEKLRCDGYPVITGVIQLPDGAVAPKGGIPVNVFSGDHSSYSQFSYSRDYVIKEGSNQVLFQVFMGREFAQDRFLEGFSVTARHVSGYEEQTQAADTSPAHYRAVLVKKEVYLISGKMVFPQQVVFKEGYTYSIEFNVMEKEYDHWLLTRGNTCEGSIQKGQKEVTFTLDCLLPGGEAWDD